MSLMYALWAYPRPLLTGKLSILMSSECVRTMGGSPGEFSEELVMQEKRKKGWRFNCDVAEATEGLENELT